MIPPKIDVLGKPYRVTTAEKLETDDYGNCDYEQCQIDISTEPCRSQIQDALLHEVMHAVSHEMHCGLTEPQVRRQSTGLLAVFKHNPALVAYLMMDDADAKNV